jgi:hypothetical protein
MSQSPTMRKMLRSKMQTDNKNRRRMSRPFLSQGMIADVGDLNRFSSLGVVRRVGELFPSPVSLFNFSPNICVILRVLIEFSSRSYPLTLLLQSMVVCEYGLSSHCRYLRSHGIGIQYMRFSRALEGLHTSRSSRGEWS